MMHYTKLSSLFIPFLIGFFLAGKVQAQLFTLNTQVVEMDVTTDQTPAHWYINITSNLSVDTTLRWQARFDRIKPEWHIGFTDPTANYPVINDGDSADFVLEANPAVQQKFVISNTMNDVTGRGTVIFAVYDPSNPIDTTSFEFRFSITQGLFSSLDEKVRKNSSFLQMGNTLQFEPDLLGAEIAIYDINGRLLMSETLTDLQLSLMPEAHSIWIVALSTPKGSVETQKIAVAPVK